MKPFGSAHFSAVFAAVLFALFASRSAAGPVLMPPAVDPVCAGAGAQVTASKVDFSNEMVTANGTWSVTGGAAGALLEYRVDNDRWFSEVRAGASGSWDVRFKFNDCGLHRMRIYISPAVDAAGRMVSCLDHATSAALDFENYCGPKIELGSCEWECEDDSDLCAGNCSGVARDGELPYAVFWSRDGKSYQMTTAESPDHWSVNVTCAPGEKVFLKVRDRGGVGGFSRPLQLACGSH